MGATIHLRWLGLGIDEPIDHPGFGNDDTEYARWIENVKSDRSITAMLQSAGFSSLLHCFPMDYSDKRIEWVEAERLKNEATRLAEEIEGRTALGIKVSAIYKAAPGESANELLVEDLRDVTEIAEFAIDEGVKLVALTVGW